MAIALQLRANKRTQGKQSQAAPAWCHVPYVSYYNILLWFISVPWPDLGDREKCFMTYWIFFPFRSQCSHNARKKNKLPYLMFLVRSFLFLFRAQFCVYFCSARTLPFLRKKLCRFLFHCCLFQSGKFLFVTLIYTCMHACI